MENPPNIISISGRMHHGKDTVAEIIQYLTYIESSHSFPYTFKEFLSIKNELNLLWENKKMAYKLKQIASILLNIEISKFEDQEFKLTNLPEIWNKPDNTPMNIREFLQLLGTNAIRDNLHVNTWANAFWADYKENQDKWLISDVRFPNEYYSVVNRNGITIKIIRNIDIPENEHISEKSLDGFLFDYVIHNNKTLNYLIDNIREILVDLKIVK
jgi:hypothetical protein